MKMSKRRIIFSLLVLVTMFAAILFFHSRHQNLTFNTLFMDELIGRMTTEINEPPHENVTILYWTKYHVEEWFGMKSKRTTRVCSYPKCHCTFSYVMDDFNKSDAVMFDFRAQTLVKKGKLLNIPAQHPPNQYWVLLNYEYLRHKDEAETLLKPGIFNLSATYNRKSDIIIPYGECVPRSNEISIPNKTGLAIWFRSMCGRPSLRDQYVDELKKYMNVNVQGTCIKGYYGPNRIGWGDTLKGSTEQINAHKFYLAFENNFCRDYISEKSYKVMDSSIWTVPVVRGSGPYKDIFPQNSYIDTADYDSPKELADYLNLLDKNDTLYKEYFTWRHQYQCFNYFQDRLKWACNVCDGICKFKQKKVVRSLDNLDMFQVNRSCYFPKTIYDHELQTISRVKL